MWGVPFRRRSWCPGSALLPEAKRGGANVPGVGVTRYPREGAGPQPRLTNTIELLMPLPRRMRQLIVFVVGTVPHFEHCEHSVLLSGGSRQPRRQDCKAEQNCCLTLTSDIPRSGRPTLYFYLDMTTQMTVISRLISRLSEQVKGDNFQGTGHSEQ